MERVDVAVIGGGLAGWTAAATAARGGARVTIVDRDRSGGRAATDQVGEVLFNRGAHALYATGPGVAALRELGIEPAGGTPSIAGAQGRLGDGLHLLPVDPRSVIRSDLIGLRAKAQVGRLLGGIDHIEPASVAHLTIDEWLDGLCLRDDARTLVAAVVRLSSYVADHAHVSADVAVTQLRSASKGVLYLHGGWRQLVDDLARVATTHGTSHLSAAATGVEPTGDGVQVTTTAGDLTARQVVLAPGNASAATQLLGRTPDDWHDLGPAAEASCLDVAIDDSEVPPPPLVLGIDEPLYLNSHAVAHLAPSGTSVVHVMRYLRAGEPWSPDEGRAALERHLAIAGVSPDRVRQSRYLHRMTVTSALPVPARGGMAGRPGVTSTDDDRILVAGDWVGPVGNLADAPIASGATAGRLAATRAARDLAR